MDKTPKITIQKINIKKSKKTLQNTQEYKNQMKLPLGSPRPISKNIQKKSLNTIKNNFNKNNDFSSNNLSTNIIDDNLEQNFNINNYISNNKPENKYKSKTYKINKLTKTLNSNNNCNNDNGINNGNNQNSEKNNIYNKATDSPKFFQKNKNIQKNYEINDDKQTPKIIKILRTFKNLTNPFIKKDSKEFEINSNVEENNEIENINNTPSILSTSNNEGDIIDYNRFTFKNTEMNQANPNINKNVSTDNIYNTQNKNHYKSLEVITAKNNMSIEENEESDDNTDLNIYYYNQKKKLTNKLTENKKQITTKGRYENIPSNRLSNDNIKQNKKFTYYPKRSIYASPLQKSKSLQKKIINSNSEKYNIYNNSGSVENYKKVGLTSLRKNIGPQNDFLNKRIQQILVNINETQDSFVSNKANSLNRSPFKKNNSNMTYYKRSPISINESSETYDDEKNKINKVNKMIKQNTTYFQFMKELPKDKENKSKEFKKNNKYYCRNCDLSLNNDSYFNVINTCRSIPYQKPNCNTSINRNVTKNNSMYINNNNDKSVECQINNREKKNGTKIIYMKKRYSQNTFINNRNDSYKKIEQSNTYERIKNLKRSPQRKQFISKTNTVNHFYNDTKNFFVNIKNKIVGGEKVDNNKVVKENDLLVYEGVVMTPRKDLVSDAGSAVSSIQKTCNIEIKEEKLIMNKIVNKKYNKVNKYYCFSLKLPKITKAFFTKININQNKNNKNSIHFCVNNFSFIAGNNNVKKQYKLDYILNYKKNVLCKNNNLLSGFIIKHCENLLKPIEYENVYNRNMNKIENINNFYIDNCCNYNYMTEKEPKNIFYIHNQKYNTPKNNKIENWPRKDLSKEIQEAENYIKELRHSMSYNKFKYDIIGLLNILTVDNLPYIMQKIEELISVNGSNNEILIVDIIIDKAIKEKSFVNLYAQLFNELYKKIIDNNIKNILIQNCSKKYNNLYALLNNMENSKINDNDDDYIKSKIKFLGIFNFISELINVNLLSEEIGFYYLEDLFSKYTNNKTNNNIKYLCLEAITNLISKFGKIIYNNSKNNKSEEKLNTFIETNLNKIITNESINELPGYIKYKIINLIEKQKNKWEESLFEKSILVKGKNSLESENSNKNNRSTCIKTSKAQKKSQKNLINNSDHINSLIKEDIEKYMLYLKNSDINLIEQLNESINNNYDWSITETLITETHIDLDEIVRSYVEVCIDNITNENKIFIVNEYIKNIINYYSVNLTDENYEIFHMKMINLFLNIREICIDNNLMYQIMGYLMFILIENKLYFIKDLNSFIGKEKEIIICIAKVVKFVITFSGKSCKKYHNDFKQTKLFVDDNLFNEYVTKNIMNNDDK